MYLSVTATVLLAIAVVIRRRLDPHAGFWLWWTVAAMVLALGPELVVGGRHTGVPMPIDVFRVAVPFLEYNLEPDRIIVMGTISAAVVSAMVLSRLDTRRASGRVVLTVVAGALLFELWPVRPPSAPLFRPRYVAVLGRLPRGGVIDDGAVNDGTVDKSLQLYDAVLDGQPLAFGYISRTPGSVSREDAQLQAAIDAHNYHQLCSEGFRYATTPAAQPWPSPLQTIYDADGTIIYRLC